MIKYDKNRSITSWNQILKNLFLVTGGLYVFLFPINKVFSDNDFKNKKTHKDKLLRSYIPTIIGLLYVWKGLNNIKNTI